MEIGIFAKTFIRPTLAETLGAVVAQGVECVQFNLTCAGMPTMPDQLDEERVQVIGLTAAASGVRIAAVSGTFNMIHPDPVERWTGLRRLRVLASACKGWAAPLLTLCTGSRDPLNMWQRHPDNDTPAAWRDLVESMRTAVAAAEEHDIVLGVEPEVANVIDSPQKARRLLDELGSPRVKIVMDAANIFQAGQLPRMREVLEEAFELLGRDIVLAHAKDLRSDGHAGDLPAGAGVLDYDLYLSLLQKSGYRGPVVLHGLSEEQVPAAVAFLRGKLTGLPPAPPKRVDPLRGTDLKRKKRS